MSVYDSAVSPAGTNEQHGPRAPIAASSVTYAQVRRPFPSPEERKKTLIEELSRRAHFLSLKEFLDIYDRNGNDEQAAIEGYAKYKELYLEEQYKDFYEKHKSSEWFQDFFMPSRFLKILNTKRESIMALQNVWQSLVLPASLSLLEGIPDDSKESRDHTQGLSDLEEGEDVQVIRVTADPATLSFLVSNFFRTDPFLFIRSVHPSISRDMLKLACSHIPDFSDIFMGAPCSTRRWFKPAWVTFRRQSNAQLSTSSSQPTASEIASTSPSSVQDGWMDDKWKALDGLVLNQFELRANLYSPMTDKWRVCPGIFTTRERITKDYQQALSILHFLSQFYDVPLPDFANPPISSESNVETNAHSHNSSATEEQKPIDYQLDRVILYLRSVFNFCYYCGCEYENVFELYRECGTLHLRKSSEDLLLPESIIALDSRLNQFQDQLRQLKDSHISIESIDRTSDINMVLLKTHVFLAESAFIEGKSDGSKDVDANSMANLNNITDANVSNIPQTATLASLGSNIKSRCSLCMKLFKGPDYVLKHLSLKHPQEVQNVKEGSLMNALFQMNRTIFKNAILSERAYAATNERSAFHDKLTDRSSLGALRARRPDPDRYYGPGYAHQYPNRPKPANTSSSDSMSHRAPPYQRNMGSRPVKSYLDLDAPSSMSTHAIIDYGSFDH